MYKLEFVMQDLKILKTMIGIIIAPAMIVLFSLLFSNSLNAQYNYSKYIAVEKEEKQKTFIDMLFELNPASYNEKAKKNPKTYYKIKAEEVAQDTTPKRNRIASLREGGDAFYLYLELIDRDETISINVYNMLGKKVLSVYDGQPLPNGIPYEIVIAGPPPLPNGVSLCVVVGKNFKLREKFVVSKR